MQEWMGFLDQVAGRGGVVDRAWLEGGPHVPPLSLRLQGPGKRPVRTQVTGAHSSLVDRSPGLQQAGVEAHLHLKDLGVTAQGSELQEAVRPGPGLPESTMGRRQARVQVGLGGEGVTVTSTLGGGHVMPGRSHASHHMRPVWQCAAGTVTLTEEEKRGSRNPKAPLKSLRDLA